MQRFILGKEDLGKGAFGHVVSALDSKTQRKVACKKQLKPNKYEYRVLLSLATSKASDVVPEPLLYSEESDGSSMLFIEKLDCDLSHLSRQSNMQSDYKLLLSIAISLFRALRKLHDSGWVHRDIKPGNIMLRQGAGKLYLVDFGMAKRYLHKDGTRHIAFLRSKHTVVGTAKYLSLWAHRHMEQSRRDDCVSAMYTLAQVANGRLPWAKGGGGKPAIEDVYMIKRRTTADDLFGGLPPSFASVYRLITQLGFYDRPAYSQYTKLFVRDLNKLS